MARQVTKYCEILEDIDLDDFIDDKDKIILLQAMVRGFLVRKWVAETRSSFEAIAQEIEQRSNITVEWKYHCLCSPAMRKKQRKKPETKIKSLQIKSTDTGDGRNIYDTTTDKIVIDEGKERTNSEMSEEANSKSEIQLNDFTSNYGIVKETPEDTCTVCSEGKDNPTSPKDILEENFSSANRSETSMPGENAVASDSSRQIIPSDSRNDSMMFDSGENLMTSDSRRYYGAIDSRIKIDSSCIMEADKTSFNSMASTQTKNLISLEPESVGISGNCDIYAKQTGTAQNFVDKSTSSTDLLPVRLKSLAIQTDMRVSQPETISQTVVKPPKSSEDRCPEEIRKDAVGSRSYLEIRESHNSTDESSLPLGDSTSFWGDSSITFNGTQSPQDKVGDTTTNLRQDPKVLKEKRHHVAMELLWVQQAIQSRKNYLRLKHQMKTPVKG